MKLMNFGRNITLDAEHYCRPESEDALLAFINRHRNRRIRCVGRMHSWSDVLGGGDAYVDMQSFQSLELAEHDQLKTVRAGAGCQLKQIVRYLNPHGLTLPTLGLIDEQSIAGAIATGTHGSGRHSLSHYALSMRIAVIDPDSGQATIRTISSDSMHDLRAARCGLGSMGVVLEVELPTRPQYNIEEHFQHYPTVDKVLASEELFKLQQFYLAPWRWNFFAQHRKMTGAPRSWLAPLYRAFWSWGMDTALHLWICALARWLPGQATILSFKHIIPRLIPIGWKVVDRSDRQLTMQHECFRHIEVEIFVPAQYLSESLEVSRDLLERYAAKKGVERYVHHYPICIRRVLPDDTLVSPASALADLDENPAWYTLSFVSYAQPDRRDAFQSFARELVEVTMKQFKARAHWAKFCPVNRELIQRAYPGWTAYCCVLRRFDRDGTFMNPWMESLADPPAAAGTSTQADAPETS